METQITTEKSIICSACHIKFQNLVNYKLHLTTEYHVYNTKRRMADMEPITEEIFEQKKATLQSACQSLMSDTVWKCQPCSKNFKSMEQLDEHKKSKKHRKNEKQFKETNPELSKSSLFQNVSKDNLSLTDEINKESERLEVKEDTEGSQLPQRTTLDSLRICLFCNREFDGFKKCFDHMRVKHSFFILDIDCIISIKAIITYIAERIQLGQMCLFCSKVFQNQRRVQQHMMDKGHCFMNVEDEQEYEKYYDFSKTYQESGIPEVIKQVEVKESLDNEDWEEIDFEDAIEDDENEEKKSLSAISVEKSQGTHSDPGFSIIDSAHKDQSQSSFSKIQMTQQFSKSSKLDDKMDEIAEDLNFSQDSPSDLQRQKQLGKGKTREEARLGLNVKQAELMGTGEIRLGNGKIIGHKALAYIYKQKFKVADKREAVLINKISLEYRKLKAIGNGEELQRVEPNLFKNMVKQAEWTKQQQLKVGQKNNILSGHCIKKE